MLKALLVEAAVCHCISEDAMKSGSALCTNWYYRQFQWLCTPLGINNALLTQSARLVDSYMIGISQAVWRVFICRSAALKHSLSRALDSDIWHQTASRQRVFTRLLCAFAPLIAIGSCYCIRCLPKKLRSHNVSPIVQLALSLHLAAHLWSVGLLHSNWLQCCRVGDWLISCTCCRVAQAVVRAIGSRWPVRLGLLPIVPEDIENAAHEGWMLVHPALPPNICHARSLLLALKSCCFLFHERSKHSYKINHRPLIVSFCRGVAVWCFCCVATFLSSVRLYMSVQGLYHHGVKAFCPVLPPNSAARLAMTTSSTTTGRPNLLVKTLQYAFFLCAAGSILGFSIMS